LEGKSADGASGMIVKVDSCGKLFDGRFQGTWKPAFPHWMWR
jgi:hypothetical protein